MGAHGAARKYTWLLKTTTGTKYSRLAENSVCKRNLAHRWLLTGSVPRKARVFWIQRPKLSRRGPTTVVIARYCPQEGLQQDAVHGHVHSSGTRRTNSSGGIIRMYCPKRRLEPPDPTPVEIHRGIRDGGGVGSQKNSSAGLEWTRSLMHRRCPMSRGCPSHKTS